MTMPVPMNAPVPRFAGVPMTKPRLWFLYCVAGFIQAEIESLTGWSRNLIKSRIRTWRLAWTADLSLTTDEAIRSFLDSYVPAQPPMSLESALEQWSASRDRLRVMQAYLQQCVRTGQFSWKSIDAWSEAFLARHDPSKGTRT
jgi:hypothetical protein